MNLQQLYEVRRCAKRSSKFNIDHRDSFGAEHQTQEKAGSESEPSSLCYHLVPNICIGRYQSIICSSIGEDIDVVSAALRRLR